MARKHKADVRMPRSRGAVSGTLLVLLGAWGVLVPLVGPYFDLVLGPDETWDFTWDRTWLNFIPGAVAVLGGLMLLGSANRGSGGLGAWLALSAGVWFLVGPSISRLWTPDGDVAMEPGIGLSTGEVLMSNLFYWYALGAAITALAAFAMGRMSVRSVGDPGVEHEHDREPDTAAPAATGGAAGTAVAPRHESDHERGREREADRERARQLQRERAEADERAREAAGHGAAAPPAPSGTTTTAAGGGERFRRTGEQGATEQEGERGGTSRRRRGGLLSRLRS